MGYNTSQWAPLALECTAAILVSYAFWTYFRPLHRNRRKRENPSREYGFSESITRCCMESSGTQASCGGYCGVNKPEEEEGNINTNIIRNGNGNGIELLNALEMENGVVELYKTSVDLSCEEREKNSVDKGSLQSGNTVTCATGCGSGCKTVTSPTICCNSSVIGTVEDGHIGEKGLYGIPNSNWRATEVTAKIFYASETGTSKKLAEELSRLMIKAGLQAKVVNPANYEPEDLPTEKIVILIMSTWQDGKPPAHSAFLHRWMEESTEDFRVGSGILQNVMYGDRKSVV